MITWTSTLLSSLCLCFTALNCGAEVIDHLNPRWQGQRWNPNCLQLPDLIYQRALFPLVTQGPARITVPGQAFVLRLWILIQDNHTEEPLMVLWGRIADPKPAPLATLYLRSGCLVWVCKENPMGDSLFDSRTTVELETEDLPTNLWTSVDLLINPMAYQQTFGWNLLTNDPENPARRTRKGRLHMARQITAAQWEIDRIELLQMRKTWLGQIELLPADTLPQLLNPNIARVRAR